MDHARTDDGENIYSSAGNNPSLAEAVDAWVAEGPLYHGETIGEITREDFNSVGHYTQVWLPLLSYSFFLAHLTTYPANK